MKSEQVAGFVSESMAGFIGIRIEEAAAAIEVEGERYPAHLMAMTGL